MVVAFFNKPMDKLSAQAAFSLKRTSDGSSVPGSFGWYGNALIFKPELTAGGEYAVHRGGQPVPAKDLAGRTLGESGHLAFCDGGLGPARPPLSGSRRSRRP